MQRRTARRWAQASVMAVALSAGLLSGCGGDDDEPQAVDTSVDEVTAHDGKVCPDRLPQADGPDTGLGGDNPAGEAPTMPAVEKAWVCQYSPTEVAPGPEGNGDPWTWDLEGEAQPVDDAGIADLQAGLDKLTPPAADLMCTADLGPRWLLVYSTGGDLTGAVIDDFGCQSVRLTDEPFETVPGSSTASGIVPGSLTAPDGLLDLIKAAGS
jgi:hypothetical protein